MPGKGQTSRWLVKRLGTGKEVAERVIAQISAGPAGREEPPACLCARPAPCPCGALVSPGCHGAAEGLLICALLPCSVFPIQPLCGGAPQSSLPTASQVRLLSWRATLCEAPSGHPAPLHLTWPKDKLKDKPNITGDLPAVGRLSPTHPGFLLVTDLGKLPSLPGPQGTKGHTN